MAEIVERQEWRVEAVLHDEGLARRLRAAAEAGDLYEHARKDLAGRAVLTHDGDRVFAYAQSDDAAQAALRALEELARREHLSRDFRITRWHPVEEDWEDATLPGDTPEAIATHEAREEEVFERGPAEQELEGERAQAQRRNKVPPFELRIKFPIHSEAIAFAAQLEREGIPAQRHFHFLLIGAWTEDDAVLLERQIKAEASPDAEFRIEHTTAWALSQERIPGLFGLNPFVLF